MLFSLSVTSSYHVNFRYCAFFEQGFLWLSGKYRVKIHSETCMWRHNNIQTCSNISINLFELYLSPYFLLNFLSNLYIPPWLRKFFKFMVFKFLENTLASQNIDSRHFYSCSHPLPIAPAVKTLPQVLSSPLRQRWLGILGYLCFIWFVIFSNVMTWQFCK